MDVLSETEKYVAGLFNESTDKNLVYHNLVHTRMVVDAAGFIGKHCGINGNGKMKALLVAAWFHDVGYLENKLNHEDASKELAEKFLHSIGASLEFIGQVQRCIEATRIPQNPEDQLSAILCDADMFHVSQDNFMENTQVYWDELSALSQQKLGKANYLEITLKFFNNHRFKSEYGKTVLERGKTKNLAKIKQALAEVRQV